MRIAYIDKLFLADCLDIAMVAQEFLKLKNAGSPKGRDTEKRCDVKISRMKRLQRKLRASAAVQKKERDKNDADANSDLLSSSKVREDSDSGKDSRTPE